MRQTIIYDLLAIAGLGLLATGLAFVYWPLALILPGIGMLAMGLYGAYGIEQQQRIERRNQK